VQDLLELAHMVTAAACEHAPHLLGVDIEGDGDVEATLLEPAAGEKRAAQVADPEQGHGLGLVLLLLSSVPRPGRDEPPSSQRGHGAPGDKASVGGLVSKQERTATAERTAGSRDGATALAAQGRGERGDGGGRRAAAPADDTRAHGRVRGDD